MVVSVKSIIIIITTLLWRGAFSVSSSINSKLVARGFASRALSGSFSNNFCTSYTAYISWSATQNEASLESEITAKFYVERTAADGYQSYNLENPSYSITIDSTTTSGTQNFDFPAYSPVGTQQVLGSASNTVSHNPDGTRSVIISATLESGINWGTVTVNGTAVLDPIPVYVVVTFDGNGGNVSETSRAVTYGTTYGPLPVPSLEGYTFMGWFTDLSTSSQVTELSKVSKTTAHVLYAQWVPNNYTLTLIDDLAGTTSTEALTYGSPLALPVPEVAHYTFEHWADEGGDPANITQMPAENITLRAVFTPHVFAIDFETETEDGEAVDVDVPLSPVEVPFGGEISIVKEVNSERYSFMGWYMDENRTVPFNLTTMPPFNFTLYARWVEASQYVQITFGKGGYTEDSVDAIIKKFGAEVVSIENFEDDVVVVILEFVDTQSAKAFFEGYVRSPGDEL